MRFTDFAPLVFVRLRALWGIDPFQYMQSVGPERLVSNLVLGESSLRGLFSDLLPCGT